MSETPGRSDVAAAGAWVVFSWDIGPYVMSIHADELEALRSLNGKGYGEAKFVPFGADLDAVLRVRTTVEQVTPS